MHLRKGPMWQRSACLFLLCTSAAVSRATALHKLRSTPRPLAQGYAQSLGVLRSIDTVLDKESSLLSKQTESGAGGQQRFAGGVGEQEHEPVGSVDERGTASINTDRVEDKVESSSRLDEDNGGVEEVSYGACRFGAPILVRPQDYNKNLDEHLDHLLLTLAVEVYGKKKRTETFCTDFDEAKLDELNYRGCLGQPCTSLCGHSLFSEEEPEARDTSEEKSGPVDPQLLERAREFLIQNQPKIAAWIGHSHQDWILSDNELQNFIKAFRRPVMPQTNGKDKTEETEDKQTDGKDKTEETEDEWLDNLLPPEGGKSKRQILQEQVLACDVQEINKDRVFVAYMLAQAYETQKSLYRAAGDWLNQHVIADFTDDDLVTEEGGMASVGNSWKDGVLLINPGIKRWLRVQDKLCGKVHGTPQDATDLARLTLYPRTQKLREKIIAELRKGFTFHSTGEAGHQRNTPRGAEASAVGHGNSGGKFEVDLVKDRFSKPKAEGYRDLNMRVKSQVSGLYAEIQVHHPCILRFKEHGFPPSALTTGSVEQKSFTKCEIAPGRRGDLEQELNALEETCKVASEISWCDHEHGHCKAAQEHSKSGHELYELMAAKRVELKGKSDVEYHTEYLNLRYESWLAYNYANDAQATPTCFAGDIALSDDILRKRAEGQADYDSCWMEDKEALPFQQKQVLEKTENGDMVTGYDMWAKRSEPWSLCRIADNYAFVQEEDEE